MSLPEAGYGSEEGQFGSEISGAVSGVTTSGASRLQASQSQERSATMQRLHRVHKAHSTPRRYQYAGNWPIYHMFHMESLALDSKSGLGKKS